MYVETSLLKSFGQTTDSHPDSMFDQLAASSSRTFDREAGVPDGFFEAAAEIAEDDEDEGRTEKVIRVYGDYSIKLPPFVVGSLTDVEAEDDFTFPDYTLVDNETGNQWLKVPVPANGLSGLSQSDLAFATGGSLYSSGYVENFRNYPAIQWTTEPFNLTVTARWGWSTVPSDITQAVIEHALTTWRQMTDPVFARISDTGNTDKSTPLFDRVVRKYREKFNQKAYF